jgi:hypothetical protein
VLLDAEFLVFKADLHSSQWVEIKSVGDDTALFMGRGWSRSVSCLSSSHGEIASSFWMMEVGAGSGSRNSLVMCTT